MDILQAPDYEAAEEDIDWPRLDTFNIKESQEEQSELSAVKEDQEEETKDEAFIPEFKKKELPKDYKPKKADRKLQPKGYVGVIDEDDDPGGQAANTDPTALGQILVKTALSTNDPLEIKDRLSQAQSDAVLKFLNYFKYDTDSIMIADLALLRELIINDVLEVNKVDENQQMSETREISQSRQTATYDKKGKVVNLENLEASKMSEIKEGEEDYDDEQDFDEDDIEDEGDLFGDLEGSFDSNDDENIPRLNIDTVLSGNKEHWDNKNEEEEYRDVRESKNIVDEMDRVERETEMHLSKSLLGVIEVNSSYKPHKKHQIDPTNYKIDSELEFYIPLDEIADSYSIEINNIGERFDNLIAYETNKKISITMLQEIQSRLNKHLKQKNIKIEAFDTNPSYDFLQAHNGILKNIESILAYKSNKLKKLEEDDEEPVSSDYSSS